MFVVQHRDLTAHGYHLGALTDTIHWYKLTNFSQLDLGEAYICDPLSKTPHSMAPKAPAHVPAPQRDDAHDEIQPDEGNESDAGSRVFF